MGNKELQDPIEGCKRLWKAVAEFDERDYQNNMPPNCKHANIEVIREALFLSKESSGEGVPFYEETHSQTHFATASRNPEDLLIEKEEEEIKRSTYQNLSDEARQVINLVLNVPTEMAGLLLSPIRKQVSKEKLYKMMARQWKDKRYAKKVIAELENYARTI